MPVVIQCGDCPSSVELLTAAEVAERLGLAPVTIRNRSAARNIGLRMDARTRLYTAADVAALRGGRDATAAGD